MPTAYYTTAKLKKHLPSSSLMVIIQVSYSPRFRIGNIIVHFWADSWHNRYKQNREVVDKTIVRIKESVK